MVMVMVMVIMIMMAKVMVMVMAMAMAMVTVMMTNHPCQHGSTLKWIPLKPIHIAAAPIGSFFKQSRW